jgi:hypothetical protein
MKVQEIFSAGGSRGSLSQKRSRISPLERGLRGVFPGGASGLCPLKYYERGVSPSLKKSPSFPLSQRGVKRGLIISYLKKSIF